MAITWTKRLVKNVLLETIAAWEEVLAGKVFYNNLQVMPYLGYWGFQGTDKCLTCMAGARYLRKTGKLLEYNKVEEIEIFIDSFSHVEYDDRKNTMYGVFNLLDLKLPTPTTDCTNIMESLRVLREAVEINFGSDTSES